MAISILYNPVPTRIFEADGDFAAGAKAFFYLARTTTPLAAYTDSPLAVPHTWPVVADAYGLLPPVYLASGIEYKVRIEDALGSLLYAADGIANSAGGDGALPVDAYTKSQSDASFVNVDGDAMSGDLTIDKPSPGLLLDKPVAGTSSRLLGQMDGKARWLVSLGDDSAESTGNAGSNFAIQGYSDAGAYLNTPLSINRADGVVTVPANLTAGGELKASSGILRLSADNTKYLYWNGTNYTLAGGGTIWHSGNFTPGDYAPRGGVSGNWVVGSATYYTNGNIYMPWAGTYLDNVLAGKAPIGGVGGNWDVGGNMTATGYVVTTLGGNDTTTNSANTQMNTNGALRRSTSSQAYKTQIEDILPEYADKVLALRTVFYRPDTMNEPADWSRFGFVAEDAFAKDFRFANCEPEAPTAPIIHDLNAIVAALLDVVRRQGERIQVLEGAGQ